MFKMALTAQGNLTYANQAESGADHYCPYCKARMRVRHYRFREDHFFLLNDTHKSKDCGIIEKEITVDRDPKLLNCDQFAKRILSVPHKRAGNNHKSKRSPASSHAENSTLPPNSLLQLKVCGICDLDPNTKISHGVLSDLLITWKSYPHFFSINKSLGFRVLEVSLDSAENRHIRYVAFWQHSRRMFFDHVVPDTVDFEALADQLFHTKEIYNGSPVWKKPKFLRVLVAGNWAVVNKTDCARSCWYCRNAKRICTGMQIAPFISKNQLYYSDLPDNLLPKK